MEVQVLELYEMKPEYLPAHLTSQSIYVRPGELALYAEPAQWAHAGRTFHPNRLQTADVRRQGYCIRSLPAGRDWERIGRLWYDHPSSVQAREAAR